MSGCPSSVCNSPWTNHFDLCGPLQACFPTCSTGSESVFTVLCSASPRESKPGWPGPQLTPVQSFCTVHKLGSCLKVLSTTRLHCKKKDHLDTSGKNYFRCPVYPFIVKAQSVLLVTQLHTLSRVRGPTVPSGRGLTGHSCSRASSRLAPMLSV